MRSWTKGREALTCAAVGVAALLIVSVFWILGAREAGGFFGFPLDDAWIHVRFAQNLSQGHGFAFNPGEPTAGSTSPLWVVVLAAFSLVTGEFVRTAVFIGIASYLALGIFTFRAARRALESAGAALFAALVLLANVRVLWAALSGMEICLAALLALAAVVSFADEEAGRATRLDETGESSGDGRGLVRPRFARRTLSRGFGPRERPFFSAWRPWRAPRPTCSLLWPWFFGSPARAPRIRRSAHCPSSSLTG